MDSQHSDAVWRALQTQAQRLYNQEEQLSQLRQDTTGMVDHQDGLFLKVLTLFQNIHKLHIWRALMSLWQSRQSVSDYATESRTLANDSGWNNSELLEAFLHGLAANVKDQLIALDLVDDLNSLIALMMKTGKRISDRNRERFRSRNPINPNSLRSAGKDARRAPIPSPFSGQNSPESVSPPQEPMQITQTRLSPEERQRRIREGRSLLCSTWTSSCQISSTSLGSPVEEEALVSETNISTVGTFLSFTRNSENSWRISTEITQKQKTFPPPKLSNVKDQLIAGTKKSP